MCMSCWREYGSPALDTPAIRVAATLAEKVYAGCAVGGNLHAVLDDWNIEDDHFEDGEMPIYSDDPPDEQVLVERECYAALKALTLPERASALAMLHRLSASTSRAHFEMSQAP
ncbi:MAG: hypothetical protein ABL957_15715 [Parvularculaceae bacterium]